MTTVVTADPRRCIDDNAIGVLLDRRLSKSEIDVIDSHIAHCAACRELVSELVRSSSTPRSSHAVVETAKLLDMRASSASSTSSEVDNGSIQRLLALLGCERQVGKILGRKWRLDEVLGIGGMAEVYAATHVANGQRAAIKVLRREWLSRPSVILRFLREGYVANRLNHPGAVAMLDEGKTEEGTPFLVLELLEGETITTYVRHQLPSETVLWIIDQILDVLAVAHDQRVIHRDIKPENVFLTRSGSIKVLDFGIARTPPPTDDGDGVRQTSQGTLMGTPAYMPPEQARGTLDEIDARSDIWAVGATMFALLAGTPVRAEKTPNAMHFAAMRDPAPSLSRVKPSLPLEICAVVDRALAFRREDRWPNARAMQAAIRDLQRRAAIPPQRR